MSHTSRRQFLRNVAASTVAVGSVAGLSGCVLGSFEFLHGVASGDPLATRVILWTRLSPDVLIEDSLLQLQSEARGSRDAALRLEELRNVPVFWEVARDPGFRKLVLVGTGIARAAADYTVKVDAAGLHPGTTYFYRFRCLGLLSPTGRTRTLPARNVEQVKLGVVSCSNYPAGFFNVYAAIAARNDLDALLHLGDYIYEYGRGGYASGPAAQLDREVDPAGETLVLADYRMRYAQYRTDPDLQAVHAALPMIPVWDDHEITNNAWLNGAENHTEGTEGYWPDRRAAAIQAYHEWLPTRLPDPAHPEKIYRSFEFGELVALHMLDTRVAGRDKPVELTDFVGPGGFDAAGFVAAIGSPVRQLLGYDQTMWLHARLASSRATWQVLGQQVLMGRMNVPLPLLTGTPVAVYAAAVGKAQAGLPLTAAEQALLAQPAIPYNLDAWDGYAAARETVLGTARAYDRNLVVLAGDTHNAWASDLADLGGNPVGVEFATPSVSSPGLETVFPAENPAAFAAIWQQLVGPLVYANTHQRGYMVVTATPAEMRAEWLFVNDILTRGAQAVSGRMLRTLPGAGGRRLIEV
jgi:alkaline phosphatase D